MKYLVLGSAGQVGSALTQYIKASGDQVLEFDIVTDADQDLRTYENPLLDSMVSEADFVFFLAFDVGGSRYLSQYQNTFDFIDNNIALMLNTFRALKKHEKPFLFASSQMSNMSYSSYGRAKALGESYSQILGGLVVKFWNVYGVEHDLEKSHVITDFILKAKQTGTIDMMTDGLEERQFLHADDCCRALVTLAQQYNEVPRDKELHITNFEWTTVLNVAHIIAEHFPGTKVVPALSKDEVQKNKRNEADDFITQYWKPTITIEAGIADIIQKMNSTN
jgi:nucleoside-diphosphate-sugar epimerase